MNFETPCPACAEKDAEIAALRAERDELRGKVERVREWTSRSMIEKGARTVGFLRDYIEEVLAALADTPCPACDDGYERRVVDDDGKRVPCGTCGTGKEG